MGNRVLVVDADTATRIAAIRSLMGAGYQLSLAEDSWEASRVVHAEHPDLVLVADSVARSGLSLIARLFSDPATAELPVLVVADADETREAADRAGARAVIPGPASAEALVAAVAANIDSPGALPTAPRSVLSDADRLAAVTALSDPSATEQESLDRFTALASERLGVLVSALDLIDEDRQIILSKSGGTELSEVLTEV